MTVDAGLVADLLARAESAALGGVPAQAAAPLAALRTMALPPVSAARATWLGAVADGASGRYGRALDALQPLTAAEAGPPEPSLLVRAAACATAASLLRQIGDHPSAEPLDRRALDLLDRFPTAVGVDERLDAAVGSTADAVGLGDLGAARARLAHCRVVATGDPAVQAGWRPMTRLRWVETEVALLAGETPAAVVAAEAAVGLARAARSPRHLAKSAMFLGVSQALDGRPDEGAGALQESAELADGAGLLPLIWPVRAVLGTMPGLAAGPGAAEWHLRLARDAARRIAAELPEDRLIRWRGRDPMAAFLLGGS